MFNQLLQKKSNHSILHENLFGKRIRVHINFDRAIRYASPDALVARSIIGAVIYVSTDITSYSLVYNGYMSLETWDRLVFHYLEDPHNCSMSIAFNPLLTNDKSRNKLINLILNNKPDQLIWEEDEDIETQEEEYYYV